jgi:hypothetical protein
LSTISGCSSAPSGDRTGRTGRAARDRPPHEDVAAGAARELAPVVRAPVVEVTDESTLVAARRLGESAAENRRTAIG